MLKKWSIAILFTTVIWQSYAKEKHPTYLTNCKKAEVKIDEATRAKAWLLSSISEFFKDTGVKPNTAKMFTKQYLEYKQDAIGRDFDGLTEQQFAHKWGNKYNTKFANSNSLLIGQQDWVNPKVTHCRLKNENPGKSFIFHIIIEDADNQNKYIHTRDIKVIPFGNSFIIDDVLEYDN